MARTWKGRYINPMMWEDDWYLGLTLVEAHLWNYLLTNPRSVETRIGVYQLNLQTAAYHTKIDYQEIKRIFAERFTPEGKAFFELGWVILPKWIRHQSLNNNENMWKSAAAQFGEIPDWLNMMILSPTSPMYMDVEEMSQKLLKIEQIPDVTINNGKLSFGTVIYDSEALANRKKKKKLEVEGEEEVKTPQTPRGGRGGGGLVESGLSEADLDGPGWVEIANRNARRR